MLELVLMNAFTSLIYLVTVIIVVLMTLRILDKLSGFMFREWLKDASDTAKAIYLAGRVIAIALLASNIVYVPI